LALIHKHLNEGVTSPLIEYRSIAVLVLFLVLFRNHLSLGKIADHNSAFNQFVAYEMRSFMQAISLFVAFLLRNPFRDFAEMDIAF
jgi:hypothetical protein